MARPLPMHPAAEPRRLPAWQKLAYGFGDVIVGMRMTVFQFYLLPFSPTWSCWPHGSPASERCSASSGTA